MKLLIVNSNTSDKVTEIVRQEAQASASPGTEIAAVSAPFGASAIECRAQATVAAHATLEAFQKHSEGFDAGIIACFSDPGLAACRESMPFPVVGIAEAACLSACMLGSRFSIVTIGPRMIAPLQELVHAYGLISRLASIRALDCTVLGFADNASSRENAIRELITQAIEQDGAEVIVLGGAVTAGLARSLSSECPVPVLDGVSCAVLQAELLMRLNPAKPTTGSYSLP
ncbi:aspartate/glutamate racemase family protein [Marinobacterium sp. YM272]|uniref:aspartate/glutamate racemase family protein n=1 Tax=Marinobacterium sp. YM272 TaxID=3421654 RepID=UPI003D7F6915